MTRQAKHLAALLIPAILLVGGSAFAASSAGQDRSSAIHQSFNQRLATILIRGGCPYNLDKVCKGRRKGKLYGCHCQS